MGKDSNVKVIPVLCKEVSPGDSIVANSPIQILESKDITDKYGEPKIRVWYIE